MRGELLYKGSVYERTNFNSHMILRWRCPVNMNIHKQLESATLVNGVPGQSIGVVSTEVPVKEAPVQKALAKKVLGGLRMTAQPAPDVDQQLVERVQKGDKRAFDLLVIKYQHKVMAVISRLIRDHAEAQDVAQEAFIKAYRALPNFRGDSAFYTWIYRIAINTAKNHIVARNRRPPSNDLDVEEAEFYPGNDAIHEMNTPERNLLRDELQITIDQAFQDLPTDLRTAVTLREIEGLSYEEIAEVMECPVGTVRSRIFRAREAIDRRIKPLVEDI